jgi:hypothetical protein
MAQLSFGLPENANAILVDAASLDALLSRLSQGYDANDAFDLYELIVQVILRDRIWLAPAKRNLHSIELMQPWIANGAAVHFRRRVPVGATPRFYKANDPNFSRLVGTALHYDLPCFIPSEHRQSFNTLAAPLAENAICDAVAQYRYMSDRMTFSMLRQGVSRPHLVKLRIPPLPYEVIRQSRNIHDVVEQTLEQRHRFSDMRRDLSGVSALLADGSRPPREKVRELEKLQRGWSTLYRTADGSVEITLAKSGGYLAELAMGGGQLALGLQTGSIELVSAGAVDLAKLVAQLPEALVKQRSVWRLQTLQRSFERSWDVSDRQMFAHLERVFGRPRF